MLRAGVRVGSKAPAFPLKNGPAPEGALMAFKVEEKEGKPVLTPAWISRNMNVPEPAIVANGVVYLGIEWGEYSAGR